MNSIEDNGSVVLDLSPGMDYSLAFAGDFGGGNVSIQQVDDEEQPLDFIDPISVTGPSSVIISSYSGKVKITLSEATLTQPISFLVARVE